MQELSKFSAFEILQRANETVALGLERAHMRWSSQVKRPGYAAVGPEAALCSRPLRTCEALAEYGHLEFSHGLAEVCPCGPGVYRAGENRLSS